MIPRSALRAASRLGTAPQREGGRVVVTQRPAPHRLMRLASARPTTCSGGSGGSGGSLPAAAPSSLQSAPFSSSARRHLATTPSSSATSSSSSSARQVPSSAATSSATADALIEALTEQYATARDEFEIASEETEKKTVYAEEDRKAAQEELGKLLKMYDEALANPEPGVKEEVERRAGQRVRELEQGMKRVEEMALED